MKATLNTLLLLLLTTTSAIAEVNFTEKTLFTSDRNMSTIETAYATYFGIQDANSITITSSYSSLGNSVEQTIDGVTYGRVWYDQSCSSSNNSYDTKYFQVTSTNKDIKQLRICVRGDKTQVVVVGWKGTVDETADYYMTTNYDAVENKYRWITFDLTSWEDIKTIRLYYTFGSNSNLKVGTTTVKASAPSKGTQPYIYGIQVGIGSTTTSISSYGVAAFSSGNALDFSTVTECSAFYADSYANGVLHLTKATGVVPAHFGLLLCSTNEGAVSFSIPIATAASTLTPDDNKFVATDESTYTPTTSTEAFALGVKDGKAGFYYVGAGVTVPQYRFYLPAPSVGGAKNLTLDFDNATGITSIPFNDPATQNSVGESSIPSQTTQPTDLLGRPCPTPRAGALYIKGGKAYLTPAR